MSDIAIRVKNITKAYQIYDKPQDRLKQSLWRGRKQFYREFQALDDVSFEVKNTHLSSLTRLRLWSFLVSHEENAAELKELGKADKIRSKKNKRKEQTRPAFPYYSILKGWQILFSLATTALHHWLRKPDKCNQRKQPSIPGLLTPPVWE